MANDVNITAGSGTPVATDEVSGRHYQLMKLVSGTEDSEARIGGDATNGLDVDPTRGAPDLSGSGTITAASGTVELALGTGQESVSVQLTGTWVASLSFDVSPDGGTTWQAWSLQNTAVRTWQNSGVNANGFFVGKVGSFNRVRVIAAGFTSGTVNVLLRAGAGDAVNPVDMTVVQVTASALKCEPDANVGHNGVDVGNPHKVGGKASAAAPADVSADGRRVNAWFLRNGAQAAVITAAGALVGGDASNGLDVDVTRVLGQTDTAHDAVDTGNPLKLGGYAKAAAPADVSADGDRVNAWFIRNGAQTCVITAAGALIGGDATNGLDVDVTRLPYDVAHDAADSGNPLKVGGKAMDPVALITKVAAADRVNLGTDLYGRILAVISQIPHKIDGVYFIQTGNHTVLAAADSSNSGRWFLENHDANVKTSLVAVIFQSQHNSALLTPTAPRIRLRRFEFTGTPSGAVITAAKGKFGDATMIGALRTASTGMTFAGTTEDIHAFYPCASLSAVGGVPNPTPCGFIFGDGGRVGLEMGGNLTNKQGVMCDQPDGGTASDTRRFTTTLVVVEYTP